MNYTKPPLTIADQADLLISRGLIAQRAILMDRLSQVNYYRLSAYWYPFRMPDGEALKPETTLDVVWDRYVFDRHLRLSVMDAVERVEVSVKTRLANILALQYGPFGYLEKANLPNLESSQFAVLIGKLNQEICRSKTPFVAHYKAKYTGENRLPIWMAVEIMDFGSMLTLYRGCDSFTKRQIAAEYGLSGKVMESWLMSLNYIRNICAHHGRLWNQALSVSPVIPALKNNKEFHLPVAVPPNTTFAILSVLSYLMNIIAPQSQWKKRLYSLWFVKHPEIPLAQMGFPPDWEKSALWHNIL